MVLLDIIRERERIMKINEYIKSMINDPWIDTDFEGYKFIGNVQKGEVGEVYVSNYMKDEIGVEVLPADCGTNGPYDRIVDLKNTEIKFSAAHSDNSADVPTIKRNKRGEVNWTINHVAVEKCWERLIFCGMDLINSIAVPNLIWCTKQDFINCLNETTLFKRQQGGKDGTNDDFMCAAGAVIKWMESDYTKDIAEWN